MRVVMRWSYGNVLYYDLSVFLEFEKLPYSSVISISAILNMLPHITKHYKDR